MDSITKGFDSIVNPISNGVNSFFNNLTNPPKTPTPAPVTPPTAPTTPVPPVSKPTSVVSSKPATNVANTAQGIVNNPPTPPAYDTTTGLLTAYGKSQGLPEVNAPKVPTPTTQAQSTNTPTTPVSTPGNPTAEDQVLHEGQTQFYNNTSGQPEWLDNSQITTQGQAPTGYSSTNPQTVAVTGTITDNNNNTLNQYSDGHYGLVDSAGNYVNITAQTYNNAKAVSDSQTALSNLQNGILTPDQQSQINNLITIQQKDMSDLISANANQTGGTTLAENLYGMGNTQTGQGAITKVITDGAQKVAQLQAAQAQAITDMKNAFQDNDTKALSTAYSNYSGAVNSIKDEISTMTAAVAKQQDQVAAANTSINESMAKKYTDTTDPILPTDTAAQRQAKLQTSPTWQADTTVAASLTPAENDFMAQMAVSGVSLSNMFPSLGIGQQAAATKTAILKSMIDTAQKTGLTGQELADSMLDKQSKAKTYTKLQAQGTQLAAQEQKVESDFDLVKTLGAKVGDSSIQGAAPILQNWINTGTLAATNNPALNNWLGSLTTSLTNYARVVAGQTGSGSTTASMNTEVQNLLKKGLSVATVNDYIDNVAKPEMRNTVSGYNSSMQQLMGDVNQADGTVLAGGLGAGSSQTDSSSDPLGLGI